MATFKFFGPGERTYPDILVDGRVLVADPGESYELDEAPADGLWIQVAKPGSHDKAAA